MMFAFANSTGTLALLISSVLVTFFLNEIGYATFYYCGAGLSVVAAILLVFFKEEKIC